jgi:hypothetical protein
MRFRAILAVVLVAAMLSGAGFGPVCEAACGGMHLFACGDDGTGMQAGSQMVGMEDCDSCSKPVAAMSAAGLCGHSVEAEVLVRDGHEGGGGEWVVARVSGMDGVREVPVPIVRSLVDEAPPGGVGVRVSLSTNLRV